MNVRNCLLGLALTVLCSPSIAEEKRISLNMPAPYVDTTVIANNILDECVSLGVNFSDSTRSFLEKDGWTVEMENDTIESDAPLSLSMYIVNAVSAGNAWMGHRKSVSIKAELRKNGELIETFTGTRNSSGGFGAGFKSSCDVLDRCVNTLGNDITKWLAKQNLF